MHNRLVTLLMAGCFSLGCGAGSPAADPANAGWDGFWTSLNALCGNAFEGRLVQGNQSDEAFAQSRLVMHVRECDESVIRIPFHVGEDRSRTWVLTRTESGIRLKHDHRHEDGSPEELTQYGGDTASPGTPEWQEFPADQQTAEMLPAAATNVWTVEVIADNIFAYSLRREGTDRRFRVEFDLTRAVEPPPAPWGFED